MRIQRILVRDFRGVDEAEVMLGDGVTIIEGPNEAGKSTLAEAFRLARTQPAGANNKETRPIRPVDRDASPYVEIDLMTGPYDLTFRKRWSTKKDQLTELEVRAPRGENKTGVEAHQRFNEILAETMDLDLLDSLEIIQGASLQQPDLATPRALRTALGDSGEDLAHDDALMDRINQDYARFFTEKGGNPTKELAAAQKSAKDAAELAAVLAAQEAELDDLTAKYEAAEATLSGDRAAVVEAREQVEEHRQKLAGSDELVRAADKASQEAAQATESAAEATRKRDARAAILKDEGDRAAKVAELESGLEGLSATATASEEKLKTARDALTSAEQKHADAREREAAARRRVELHRDRETRADLAARIASAKDANERLAAANAQLDGVTVSDKDVRKLTSLDQELRIAQAKREAAAPKAVVRALGGASVSVGEDDVEAGASREFAVVDQLHVEVPGVVAVDVLPGTDGGELDAEIEKLRGSLRAALDKLGVDDLDQAHDVAQRQNRARDDAATAKRERDLALKDAELTDLEGQLAAIDQRLAGAGDADDGTSLEDLTAVADAAHTDAAEAEKAVIRARTAVDRARDEAQSAALAATKATEELRTLKAELDRVRADLDQARQETSDEDLERAAITATESVATAEARSAAAQQALKDADIENLRFMLDNALKAVDRHEKAAEASNEAVLKQKGAIDRLAAQGTYDKAAEAQREMAATAATLDRVQARADAVNLLRTVMSKHREAAQTKYVAPFRERIEQLGSRVFGPSFKVEVSKELQIVTRTLDGATVPFESLSAGAREQVSLLGRLAAAQLIDEDQGAPIILDDALGFSDEKRLQQLNAALSAIGDSAQVIVLTSQPGRFKGVGSAKTERPFM